ncbi:NYN domain-containing protein [Candidatus Pacearchaeota archaeon]|nr:NYN domain-containing protein [Candidatus Pacearchaeota archaeon]
MSAKAIIFFDANNWYHNVKNYFKPSDIDIKLFKDLIAERFDLEIVEVRWYASMPSLADGELMYKRHRNFLGGLEKKGVKLITRKLQRLSNKESLKKKQDALDDLDLCAVCKPLVEAAFLDLADIKKKEKGIDVWIAIDMINLSVIEDKCDTCVLVSGDADFVPALNLIKKKGKEILTAMTPKGYSSELRNSFPYFILKKEILIKCMRDYKEMKQENK